jgi:hypothetical protein
MIRCNLVQITRNRHGKAVRTERRIAGDSLRIGRGAECAIHLPDQRVGLRHAVIREAAGGKHYIEADGASFSIGGALRQGAELAPGSRILIGPYELVVEAPADGVELVISVELINRRPQEDAILARAPASLAAAGLSKRRPAFWLAALITVLFLLLPLLQASGPAARQAMAGLSLTPDLAWNPGPLLAGHQAFAKQCEKCHQQAFQSAADAACTACHHGIARHFSPSAAAAIRCAECHRDHKGEKGLVTGDKPLCVACHENAIDSRTGSALAKVPDFGADHPGFRLSFAGGRGQPARRVSLSDRSRLVEQSGLKFSHKAHSGKLRIPSDPQTIRTMNCGDCHLPDSGGLRFKPVAMKEHCFDCHREKFDFDPPQDEHRLPHGSERAVMDVLEHFYLMREMNGDVSRGGGGAGKVPARQVVEGAVARAHKAAGGLIEDMGCGFCHEIDGRDKGLTSWKVRPVRITQHWLPAAQFPHDKHRTSGCIDCHDIGRSEKSSDVAIPDIAKCRECHAGEAPGENKVASPCAACHRFHQAAIARPDLQAGVKGLH